MCYPCPRTIRYLCLQSKQREGEPDKKASVLRGLLCVLLVLLFLVDLVHLRLERLVEFLDMSDVRAEVAGEVAQQRSLIWARQTGARAYFDIAGWIDHDPHVVLEFENSRGVDAIEGVAAGAGLDDLPSAERVDGIGGELEQLHARNTGKAAANQFGKNVVERRG